MYVSSIIAAAAAAASSSYTPGTRVTFTIPARQRSWIPSSESFFSFLSESQMPKMCQLTREKANHYQ
uniref:Putative secreted protein n=1 Tax=Anopheles darlingi TaxID=43151 RepID=A0A2M4D9Z6_ANODA